MSDFTYVGEELDLFSDVRNWKAYWSGYIRPFIKGDILEVGAGIGANTDLLDQGGSRRFVCLEPDPQLIARLERKLAGAQRADRFELVCGTLDSIPGEQFDSICYIDVLEHIENDREEMVKAAAHLRPGGHLIVLSPAHQRLYTPFDKAIGHFRRYNRPMMVAVSPPGLKLQQLSYLDSAGLLASSANLLFLQQSMPTKAQLRVWDNWIVPVSRTADKLFGHSIGKSIIGVWQKPLSGSAR